MNQVNKREWRVTNTSAVAASASWYPFTEEDSPTDYEIDQYFPLKTAVIINKSSQDITLVLDPKATNSKKEYTVPNGKTLTIEIEDNITFYQLLCKNVGSLEIAIGDLQATVRNY